MQVCRNWLYISNYHFAKTFKNDDAFHLHLAIDTINALQMTVLLIGNKVVGQAAPLFLN